MVQTEHRLERQLVTRCDFIGFHCVTGHYTGEHFAKALFAVFKRLNLINKVLLLSNLYFTYNNIL